MNKLLPKHLYSTLIFLLLFGFAQPASAFYAWQGEESEAELRGFISGSGIGLTNPDNTLFYNRKNISGLSASGRLMLDVSSDRFSLEAHAQQGYVPLVLQTGGARFANLTGVERSDLLDWSFDSKQSHLILDRLNVQFSTESLNIKVGRQPVNLGVTNYFTPNDFFAPFAAQAFFRAYKPGVDAVRADIQMGELAQLSLITVLGYSTSSLSDNGWSNRPDSARHAYLARASRFIGDFEFALLAGSVRKNIVIGGDIQGELFEWLGIRAEGHVVVPDQAGLQRKIEIAVGIEHRWENSLSLRAEQFHHGAGASSTSAYALGGASQSLYLAKNYSAVGASYEFTPLFTGDVTTIYNWLDQSALVALYGLYSLTDESELAISGTLSTGKKTPAATIQSEFGLYAGSVSIEYRAYF